MNSINTVAAELGLRLVVPEHDGVPLTASLHYRAEDPYAIRMAFHVGMDEPVEWIFARDLLAPARLFEQAGQCLLLLGASPELTAALDRYQVPVVTVAADSPPPPAA